MLGLFLLAGSLLLIAVNLARLGTTTVISARERDARLPGAEPQAVIEVGRGVARTVKYVVIPGALLLLAGVLLRGGSREERGHELRVETEE